MFFFCFIDEQASDLCLFCQDRKEIGPMYYLIYVRAALDHLFLSTLPRTLINLVLTFEVHQVSRLIRCRPLYEIFLKELWSCAAFPTPEQAKILDD